MAFDTIIKGGRVVDGSGLPMRVADVGIKAGMITDVGRLAGARRTIAADGLVVMPGIIDVHTHYDPQLTFEPLGTSSCYHGVTSVVAGNCGYSIAPCRPADRAWLTEFFADRKSTRLNSSHVAISYAVFCLKKKNKSIMAVIFESGKEIDLHYKIVITGMVLR